MVHEKWQIDVKFVPAECKASNLEGRFYQYTILDECSRKRILYFTNEHTMYETVKALIYAYNKIGCFPKKHKQIMVLNFRMKLDVNQKESSNRKKYFGKILHRK